MGIIHIFKNYWNSRFDKNKMKSLENGISIIRDCYLDGTHISNFSRSSIMENFIDESIKEEGQEQEPEQEAPEGFTKKNLDTKAVEDVELLMNLLEDLMDIVGDNEFQSIFERMQAEFGQQEEQSKKRKKKKNKQRRNRSRKSRNKRGKGNEDGKDANGRERSRSRSRNKDRNNNRNNHNNKNESNQTF